MALFLLPIAGTKEKAKQKENTVEGVSPPAGGDQGSAFGNRRLLKKAGENFKKGVGRLSPIFLPTLSPGEDLALR